MHKTQLVDIKLLLQLGKREKRVQKILEKAENSKRKGNKGTLPRRDNSQESVKCAQCRLALGIIKFG